MTESEGGGDAAPQAADGAVRVLVCDDALVARALIGRALESADNIELVGTARDGRRALQLLERLAVDVVVLDIDMPIMDGMETLERIVATYPHIRVVMASTLTRRNAEISLRAMQLGAADYIAKPEAADALRSAEGFKHDLVEKVRALGATVQRADTSVAPGTVRPVRRGGTARDTSRAAGPVARRAAAAPETPALRRIPAGFRPEAIAIGCSTGGPQALTTVLRDLGAPPVPVFVTQHMPATFTRILAENLAKATGRPCVEAEDGAAVADGTVYVARGGYHMTVVEDGGRMRIRLDDGPRENFCQPSVEPMLRSLTAAYRGRVLCAILTGMGGDGARAATALADSGGVVVAQDEATSVIWGMPAAAVRAGACARIVPLESMGETVRKIAGGRAA